MNRDSKGRFTKTVKQTDNNFCTVPLDSNARLCHCFNLDYYCPFYVEYRGKRYEITGDMILKALIDNYVARDKKGRFVKK